MSGVEGDQVRNAGEEQHQNGHKNRSRLSERENKCSEVSTDMMTKRKRQRKQALCLARVNLNWPTVVSESLVK